MGAGRGAPYKKGLDYFPKMVDFYEDDRIFDLLEKYGPLGVTVYDVVLTIIYSNGYYAEMSEDKLSRMVIRKIGSKWAGSKKAVVQVIRFCAAIGLFDEALLSRGIITSVGIQKRYYKIAVKLMKRQLYNDAYWLLGKEENGESLLNAPKNRISTEENMITSADIPFSSEEIHTKEKENKRKDIYTAAPGRYFENDTLNEAFLLFIGMRRSKGDDLTEEQVLAYRDDLLSLSKSTEEQTAIVKKAFMNGWKNFYPPKGRSRGKKQAEKNRFNNFHQREYDFGEYEKALLNHGQGEEPDG